MSTEIKDLSWIGSITNGAISSFCNISITHPLFTIKTISQLPLNDRPTLRGAMLYRGYPANLSCDLVCQITNFYANCFFGQVILEGKSQTNFEKCIGGAFSGTIAAITLTPFERGMILKQKGASLDVHGKDLGYKQLFSQIHEKEGVFGYFKGLTPTIARESINSLFFFGLSRIFKEKIQTSPFYQKISKNNSDYAEPILEIGSYFTAGILSGTLTSSFDLVKTRMQGEIGKQKLIETIQQIIQKEGSIRLMTLGAKERAITLGCTSAVLGPISIVVRNFLLTIPLFRESV